MVSMDARRQDWRNYKEELQGFNSILIAGAGAVGLEAAGFLKDSFPDKQIGVCVRGQKLMSTVNGVHEVAEPILKEIGINIHKGTPYQEGTLVALPDGSGSYEHVIDCRGFRFQGPSIFFKSDKLKSCIYNKNG